MTRRTAWILAALLTFAGLDASAVGISLDPAQSTLSLGESVDVDLIVSGLGDMTAPSLGIFDIDVAYDPGVLQLNFVSFGSELSVLFPSIQIATPSIGSVNLFELSLDAAVDLDANQPGSFTIATLTFELVAFGSSAITPTVTTLGDGFALPLPVDSVRGATVSAIPEPSAAVLWAAGLLVLRGRLRRRL
jgi:hypothetical protein